MKQPALPGLDQHPSCPGSPKMSTSPDNRKQPKEHGESIPASPSPLPISLPFVIIKNQAFQQHGTEVLSRYVIELPALYKVPAIPDGFLSFSVSWSLCLNLSPV